MFNRTYKKKSRGRAISMGSALAVVVAAGLGWVGREMGDGSARSASGGSEGRGYRVAQGGALPLATNFNGPGRRSAARRNKSVEGRSHLVDLLRLRRPSEDPSPAERDADGMREITIAKSSAVYDDVAGELAAPRRTWKYLGSDVRRQIDAAVPRKGRWQMIVLHNSQTTKGSAKAFDYYHRNVKGMENGLAYHFVIGNGSYTGNGQIEVGHRWLGQIDGGHLRSGDQNRVAIGICLVGDFNNDKVSREQLAALDELVEYLRAKVGHVDVTTHERINVSPTDCPGRYFPTELVMTLR